MKKRFAGMAALAAAVVMISGTAVNVSAVESRENSLATNEELEQLIDVMRSLNGFIYENGYGETSAYASLKWYSHSVSLFVKSEEIKTEAVEFIDSSGIERNLVNVVVSPEYDFSFVCGGQKGTDEVNTIVADEYFALKEYMNGNGLLGNIFLTLNHDERYNTDVTMVEICVREQEAADEIARYMVDNYFWADVVRIKVAENLAPAPADGVKNRAFVVAEGDTNDDGVFGIADVIYLQKYLLGTAEINERQAVSSDICTDSSVNVFDLVAAKAKLTTDCKMK